MDGTQVLVNSLFAPLYYVDSSQINAQVPWEVSGASYLTVQVIVKGLPSNLVTVALAANAPGLLQVTHAVDGSLVTSSRPAMPGEHLMIYGVGLGPVSNPPATGAAASANRLSNTLLTPVLMIGGVAANVSSSSLTPGQAPAHWAVTGKGSATAYYLPQESGQPQVPSRGSYCLRLIASDSTAAISAMSDQIAVTPGTSYTTTANLRFAWTGDPNPSGSATTRPQVFVTIHYLNASGTAGVDAFDCLLLLPGEQHAGVSDLRFSVHAPERRAIGANRNRRCAQWTLDADHLRCGQFQVAKIFEETDENVQCLHMFRRRELLR